MKTILLTGSKSDIGIYLIKFLVQNNFKIIVFEEDHDIILEMVPSSLISKTSNINNLNISVDIIINIFTENHDTLQKEIFKFIGKNSVDKVINVTENINTYRKYKYISDLHLSQKKLQKLENDILTKINIHNVFFNKTYKNFTTNKLNISEKIINYTTKLVFSIVSNFQPIVGFDIVISRIHSIILNDVLKVNTYAYDVKNKRLLLKIFKKFIDFSFVLIVSLLFWWLMVLIWAIVKISSKGPGIFIQKRVGKNGIIFNCYKFRTMKLGTENTDTHKINKKSLTTIGSFLRSSKLDELPQIFNIIKGELSLVGPRPGLPSQNELYNERKLRNIYSVLPGITGLSQVNNIDMSKPKKLAECDCLYVSMQSISQEISILLKTIIGNGQGDKINKP
jgi:lipopolysaccharide/colanic/teichoic acid biosynthesis glycosyltransferase